ncbi:MAG: hypothetical protein HQL39_00020 [Alphaproteobacteria bacterium]|nr:hypothetical protein [Alphaproteobacteria bacterium]
MTATIMRNVTKRRAGMLSREVARLAEEAPAAAISEARRTVVRAACVLAASGRIVISEGMETDA